MTDRPAAAITRYEVINGNDFPIDDHYDGIPVSFPPGVPVTVSGAICAHCFGYPGDRLDMAAHIARRYGWATKDMLALTPGPGKTEPRYVTLAGLIVIRPVYFDLVRRDPDAPILADTGEDGEAPPPAPPEDSTVVVRRRRTKAPPKPKAPPRAARKAREGAGARTRH